MYGTGTLGPPQQQNMTYGPPSGSYVDQGYASMQYGVGGQGASYGGGQQQFQTAVDTVADAAEIASVKEIDRTATFTFSPSAPFLATGSVAGAIDLSFSTSSQLEVGGILLCYCVHVCSHNFNGGYRTRVDI